MRRKKVDFISFYFADIAILFLSFVVMAWYKQPSVKTYVMSHHVYFAILAVVWFFVSIINGKIPGRDARNFTTFTGKVLFTGLISFGVTMIAMFGFGETSLSRIMVFGTVVLCTIVELFMGSIIFAFKKAQVDDGEAGEQIKNLYMSEYDLVGQHHGKTKSSPVVIQPYIIESIKHEIGEDTACGIIDMVGSKLAETTAVLSITNPFNLQTLPQLEYHYILNLHKLNDIKKLDHFIDEVNKRVEVGGYFCCCVETKNQRKKRILGKFPVVLNYAIYFLDFIFMRVFPKLRLTRGFYKVYFRGNNAIISRAEALGRICRGGFIISNEQFIGDYLFIEAKKKSDPLPIKENMGSMIIALERIGKGGKIIKVYKLRTMHPYSEYIQDYVYKQSNIQNGGKFKNDFRVTTWGAFCRKVWLDELPMIINMLKGELKLVGVRPLSRQYFSLYNIKVQERRVNYKPGLIPPFYKDMPQDLESIQESEVRYFDLYDKHPFFTDCNYFFCSIWNILFCHARSK